MINLSRCPKCDSDLWWQGQCHPSLVSCISCGHLYEPRISEEARKALQESAKTMWYIQLPNGQWFRENGCGAVDCSSLRALNGEKPFLIHLGRPDGEIREIV